MLRMGRNRTKKRIGAWILALVMIASLVTVPAGEVQAEEVQYSVSVSEGSSTSGTFITDQYTTSPFCDVIFGVPTEISSSGGSGYSSLALEVSVTITSLGDNSSIDTGLYAMNGSYGGWTDTYADSVTAANTTVSLSLPLKSFSSIGKLGLRFTGGTKDSTISYTINSAKVVGVKSDSSSNSGGNDTTEGNTSGDVTATISCLSSGTNWSEYNYSVTNGTESAISGIKIKVPYSGTVKDLQSWNCSVTQSDGYIIVSHSAVLQAGGSYSCSSDTKFGFGGGASLGTPVVEFVYGEDGAGTSSSSLKYSLTGEKKDVAFADTPVGKHGKLSLATVDGYSAPVIVDKNGKPYQLRGASSHGIQWDVGYNYVNKDAYQSLRDEWGVNMVRIACYITQGGYTEGSQSSMDATIQKGVTAATELGMYVIVDWHVHAENPHTKKSEAEEFFKKYATMYKDYDNVIFEICNEPTGVSWYTDGQNDLYAYCKDIAGIIRNCGSDALIVCGTNTWSQDVDEVANKPLKDDGFTNILYTFHFYSGSHYADKMAKVKTALAAGTPIFVTEFGICNASGDGGFDTANADEWIKLCDENNISYACWSLCNKNESASYLSSSCSKTTGGWVESDLATTGIWLINTYRAHEDAENGTDSTNGDFSISVEPENGELDDVKEGYTDAGKFVVTVTNTGNKALENLSAKLSVGTGFEITKNLATTSLEVGASTTFEVALKSGKTAGTYADTIRVSSGSVQRAKNIKQKVTEASGKQTPTITAPSNITVEAGTKLSEVPTTDCSAGDVKGTFTWKEEDTVLTSEQSGQTFTLVFTPEDEDSYVSVEQTVKIVVTKKTNEKTPGVPEVSGKTATSVTLKKYAGTELVEYGISSGNGSYKWQTSNEFTNLSEYTTYTFAERFAADGDYEAGAAGESIDVTTYLSEANCYVVDLGELSENAVEAHQGTISYDSETKTLHLLNDQAYTITGTNSQITVVADKGVTVTLDNAELNILKTTEDTVIELVGTNVVKNGIVGTEKITIQNGSASETAGTLKVSSATDAAIVAKTIVLESGEVTATGSESAAALKAEEIQLLGGSLEVESAEGVTPVQAGKVVLEACQVKPTGSDIYSTTPKDAEDQAVTLCNVTYKDGDTEIKTVSVNKGATTLPNLAPKDGYKAEGWIKEGTDTVLSQGSEIIVTGDVVYQAKYAAIEGGLSATVDAASVTTLAADYTADAGVLVTIKNDSNVALSDVNLSLSNEDNFVVTPATISSIEAGKTAVVRVSLKNGMSVKEDGYTTKLTVSCAELAENTEVTITRFVKNFVLSEEETYTIDVAKLGEDGYVEAHEGTITLNDDNTLVLNDAATYVITGANTTLKVLAKENVTVILQDAELDSVAGKKDVTLQLEGASKIVTASGNAVETVGGVTISASNDKASVMIQSGDATGVQAAEVKIESGTVAVVGGTDAAGIVADKVTISGGSVSVTGQGDKPAIIADEKDIIDSVEETNGENYKAPDQEGDKKDDQSGDGNGETGDNQSGEGQSGTGTGETGGNQSGTGTGGKGNGQSGTEIPAESLSVTANVKNASAVSVKSTYKLAPKKSMTLKVAFLPEGAASEKLTYTSSNPKLVTVNSSGKVTAGKKAGKATITVTSESGLKKTFKVQVMKKAVTKVKIKGSTTMKAKKKQKLKVTLIPGKSSASNAVVWKSSNTKVATVSSSGQVKALKKGKVKITAVATDGSGKKATITIKVK
jgi:hypothetical protein